MQLPEFIKKAVSFFDKWEANLTATAEKLAAALSKVATLESVVTTKDGELATLKASLDSVGKELKVANEKIKALESSNKTLAEENKALQSKEQNIAKRASEVLAQQGHAPIKLKGEDSKAQETMPRTEFNKLNPGAQAAFMKTGGKLTE